MRYCQAVYQTKRWPTRAVQVGPLTIGALAPIRIQSMTTTPTCDVEATTNQIFELVDQGCELVRVTVQGKKEALACEAIKNKLLQKHCTVPLIADIHFYPAAALSVVPFVDKVRINPGNFADKRAQFIQTKWDEVTYQQGLRRIEKVFVLLIEQCKKFKKALRIGVNHGSLSDRIMNRYGDTPEGMVESALEFATICDAHQFDQIIFSMKSSNPLVMVCAYRLLVARCIEKGWNYPLHIGLTEAGSGLSGRVKSSVAIGSLLADGLGDTIRVSLTENPCKELAVCRAIVHFAKTSAEKSDVKPFTETYRKPFTVSRRSPKNLRAPLHRDGSVLAYLTRKQLRSPMLLDDLGVDSDFCVDGVILAEALPEDEPILSQLTAADIGVITQDANNDAYPCVVPLADLRFSRRASQAVIVTGGYLQDWQALITAKVDWIVLQPTASFLHWGRRFFDWFRQTKIGAPVLLAYPQSVAADLQSVVNAAAKLGGLLVDGYGDGIVLPVNCALKKNRTFGFELLQAARLRATKTEFISCPGCGRTLFDLEKTSKRIRQKTAHFPGVKIAIMGCIVNGPGEMADADFGYVGSLKGKVDLYVGKKCVEKGIDANVADARLIELIQAAGYTQSTSKCSLSLENKILK